MEQIFRFLVLVPVVGVTAFSFLLHGLRAALAQWNVTTKRVKVSNSWAKKPFRQWCHGAAVGVLLDHSDRTPIGLRSQLPGWPLLA
jgi:hypothetical protein